MIGCRSHVCLRDQSLSMTERIITFYYIGLLHRMFDAPVYACQDVTKDKQPETCSLTRRHKSRGPNETITKSAEAPHRS